MYSLSRCIYVVIIETNKMAAFGGRGRGGDGGRGGGFGFVAPPEENNNPHFVAVAGGGFSFGDHVADASPRLHGAGFAQPTPRVGAPAPLPPPPEIASRNHFQDYVNNPKYSDITFTVDDKEVHAHKIVVAKVPYFERLINSGMRESTSSAPIVMEGVSHETFNQVLQFIYTGKVDDGVTPEDYQNRLIASDMYQMDTLKALCEIHFKKTITADTAVSLLVLAHQHNAPELKKFTLNFIMTSWRNRQLFTESTRPLLEAEPALMMDVILYIQEHSQTPAPTFSFGPSS
jgi:BTB/POZ domain